MERWQSGLIRAVLESKRKRRRTDEKVLKKLARRSKSSLKRSFRTVFLGEYGLLQYINGKVAERFNAAVLKTVVGAIPPRVRISAFPPTIKKTPLVAFFYC